MAACLERRRARVLHDRLAHLSFALSDFHTLFRYAEFNRVGYRVDEVGELLSVQSRADNVRAEGQEST